MSEVQKTNEVNGVTIHIAPKEGMSADVHLAVNGRTRGVQPNISLMKVPEAVAEALKTGSKIYAEENPTYKKILAGISSITGIFRG